MPLVRCPHCKKTFPSEEHAAGLSRCPTCSRQFLRENPADSRCPMCIANWSEYLARGGVDPAEIRESNPAPAHQEEGRDAIGEGTGGAGDSAARRDDDGASS